MSRSRRIATAATLLAGVWTVATPAASRDPRAGEAAIDRFINAASPDEAKQLIPDVLASGITFDDALERLRVGRRYSADIPTGVVTATRAERFPYAIQIPDSYTPDRRYQVRLQLHGGVTRPTPGSVSQGVGRLAGAEQIYVLPAAWNEAMWWDDAQVDNIAAILDTVKRTYNVDENHVALAGVSDGATGAYFLAMRNPTPYSAILPMIGFALVLDNPAVGVHGDLFPSNFRNRPFFIVNSGQDRLYPTRMVEPYVLDMAKRGVEVTYRPQPDAGHDTTWWPEVRDEFESFVATHPRDPLPDHLSWETSDVTRAGRLHWVVVNQLGPAASDGAPLDDLNEFTPAQGPKSRLFSNTGPSGRIDVTRTNNRVETTSRGVKMFTLLLSPDDFDLSRPVTVVSNGQTVYLGRVKPSLKTLLTWAARDNDRTMLFGAELTVQVR